MQDSNELPPEIENALSKGVLNRLPITFLPFVNQQISQWNVLFPNERQSTGRLIQYVMSLTPDQSTALFRDVRALEDKMGVRQWPFSTKEQTILNSSLLARSPYFQQWREAVQVVYDAADSNEKTSNVPGGDLTRLILLGFPSSLPMDASRIWNRWGGVGHAVTLDMKARGSRQTALEYLLVGSRSPDGQKGLLPDLDPKPDGQLGSAWVLDAESSLTEAIANCSYPLFQSGKNIALSYARLDACRRHFSQEMNSMHKDLADADAVFDQLRKVDIAPWCPVEVASRLVVREFVRSLYLSGNGAVIFGNSFVEWGASEAIRRARPRLVAAQFGMRSKPKPFTGVAVFDDPDQVNPMHAVNDTYGSAADAQMLALYVWMAALRFPEYQSSCICVCIAESLSQAYVVVPPGFSAVSASETMSLDRLGEQLKEWLA